jgi:ribose transport system permease protein
LASRENLGNVLEAMLPLLVLASGQTLVLITGGIDLSMTSVVALTSVLGASAMTGDGGWLGGHVVAVPMGVALMLLVGGFLGGVNGATITVLRMPPFIVTLTAMMFLSGFAIWSTRSQNVYGLPGSFLVAGQKTWVGLGIVALFCVAADLALRRTKWGRWLYAVGQNARAALVSGVPVGHVTIAAYVVSGVSAGLASVLLTGRLETGSPVLGREMLLDVIGATVIGGTSLYGGKGKILWTVFGVLFLTLIDSTLNLLNCSHFVIMMVKGGVILFAATTDALRTRLLQRGVAGG